jgi:hypothetical protein
MDVKPTQSASKSHAEPSAGIPVEDSAAGQAGLGKEDAQVEIGGRRGLDPTRYGDWEKNGRCIDF